MFSWWILHDCSLEVVLIIFRVKNEVHLSTKGTYSTIFYTLIASFVWSWPCCTHLWVQPDLAVSILNTHIGAYRVKTCIASLSGLPADLVGSFIDSRLMSSILFESILEIASWLVRLPMLQRWLHSQNSSTERIPRCHDGMCPRILSQDLESGSVASICATWWLVMKVIEFVLIDSECFLVSSFLRFLWGPSP